MLLWSGLGVGGFSRGRRRGLDGQMWRMFEGVWPGLLGDVVQCVGLFRVVFFGRWRWGDALKKWSF